MFQTIYIEKEIYDDTLTQNILRKYSKTPTVIIDRYGEIFNRKNQNFRFQKENPSLILAKKYGNLVLPTPKDYSIGGKNNYYFSHMLNCIFDCRYCFLQGMYRSANYVVFVNSYDFENEKNLILNKHSNEEVYFFSGYDCDSLALEPITDFVKNSLTFFEKNLNAILELRTKSTNIKFLLDREPIPNCIVAFSLTPNKIAERWEHRTPSLKSRLESILKLQKKGWKIGLRFDPIILIENFCENYATFYRDIFSQIDLRLLHSVTLGPFRLPNDIFKNMVKLYPEEPLFMHPFEENQKLISYEEKVQKNMLNFCKHEILKYIPESILFHYETH